MNSDIFRDQLAFQNLLNQAQVELRSLIAMPALEFSPNTLPYLSFDPYIGRRLNSFVPIRVLTLPEMSDTWKAFGDFFDGLYEISLLSNTKSLSTWKVRVPFLKMCLSTYLSTVVRWKPSYMVIRSSFKNCIFAVTHTGPYSPPLQTLRN